MAQRGAVVVANSNNVDDSSMFTAAAALSSLHARSTTIDRRLHAADDGPASHARTSSNSTVAQRCDCSLAARLMVNHLGQRVGSDRFCRRRSSVRLLRVQRCPDYPPQNIVHPTAGQLTSRPRVRQGQTVIRTRTCLALTSTCFLYSYPPLIIPLPPHTE